MTKGDFVVYNTNEFGILLDYLSKEETKQCGSWGQLVNVLNLRTNEKESLNYNYATYPAIGLPYTAIPNEWIDVYLSKKAILESTNYQVNNVLDEIDR